MTVGEWRYIQSIHEPPERRNPDTLVGHFLPAARRWRAKWIGAKTLSGMRSRPFYYYLVARTMHYDAILNSAIRSNIRHIIIIGSGSDTRAYRFLKELKAREIGVLECDQSQAIRIKQRIAERHWPSSLISYLPLDLNDDAWPHFESWLGKHITGQALVMMEGVSPYIGERAFGRFLELLAVKLQPGSHVAYDFKRIGVNDDLGRASRTEQPFRLSPDREDITGYHVRRCYHLEYMELSHELSARLLPDLGKSDTPLFREDVLIRLAVASHRGAAGTASRNERPDYGLQSRP